MKISIENHQKVFNYFLILLASTIVLRIVNTWLIIAFLVYNLLNIDKLENIKANKTYILLISSPLILHLLFFWNTDSTSDECKSLEKYISLFIFSFFFIANAKIIKFYFIIKTYILLFTISLVAFYFRFQILFSYFFNKYQKGIDIWERGYVFANSFNNHAPVINMHLSFALICSFYFILFYFIKRQYFKAILFSINFILLIYFLLYINTRLALLNSILGLIVVSTYFGLKYFKIKKTLLILSFLMLTIFTSLYFYVKNNQFMIKKYTTVTFVHIDKIGKLDEIKNPESVIFNSLVTRLTIWKSTLELIKKKPLIGYGASNSKKYLFNYYKNTRQFFLYRYKFPVHNQFLDFTLKFGVLGFLTLLIYLLLIAYLGFRIRNIIMIVFSLVFFLSNFTDDLMIRFDGIVYSGFWISLFMSLIVSNQNLKIRKNNQTNIY